MIHVSGYKLNNILYQSKRTIVYSGIRESDNLPVILKTLNGEHAGSELIEAIKKEYEILNLINTANVVKALNLFDYNNKPFIVMEAIEGESFAEVLNKRNLSIDEFINLAIEITEGLKGIHEKKIIHRDINVHNIIWNEKNNACKIIDFSLATDLAKESLPMVNANQLEGNLAYISPEQTGRMNRAIDYRTDYYSLGITFYKMLTNTLPFNSDDPSELIYGHIAKLATPPHVLNNNVPKVISDIVMKLISKNAEERYQSIGGLKYDLEKCLQTFQKDKIKYFNIASHDISNKFYIPELLYGREKEIRFLLEAFDRCTKDQKEILFYSGSSGIGKTSLVNEIQAPVSEKNGFFIKGKYDHYEKNIPYTGIIQAFNELFRQILTVSEKKLEEWRTKIIEALGNNAQVVSEVFPLIEEIIGNQPPVESLPPVESQNRFNVVFQNFLKVFAQSAHPLVIFLDDLHWADNASLELIKVLLNTVDLSCIMLIGTYRDDEVGGNHPLSLMLDQMRKDKIVWTDITIKPLDKNQISQFISGMFGKNIIETDPLADLIYAKTKGNPFFVREFLKTLYKKDLIYFNEHVKNIIKSGWHWDIKKIEKENITDNVVKLMVENVQNLSNVTIETMKVACCLGIRFDLDILSGILQKLKAEVLEDLKEAINEGMLLKEKRTLSFVHNRILEATYSLLSKKEKKEIHYKIGKNLLFFFKGKEKNDRLFLVAYQWNLAKDLLNIKEKELLIKLNYKAGMKAKTSAAYRDAALFFQHGAELIPDDFWQSNYSFSFQFHIAWSEAEYLARNFNKAEELFKEILSRAQGILDKQQVYAIMIRHCITQMKSSQALEIGISTLKQLGISLPKKPGKIYILKEIVKSKILLRKIETKSLINLPEMKDKRIRAAIEILGLCIPPALISNPDYVPIIILKVFNLSLVHGIAPMSPFAITMYGLILSGPMGDIQKGIEFGELGVNLLSRPQCNISGPATLFAYVTTLLHLKVSFRERLEHSKKAIQVCLNEGNFEYYGYLLGEPPLARIYMGENLNTVSEEFRKNQIKSRQLKQPMTDIYNGTYYQLVENLTGKSKDKLVLNGDQFNADKIVPFLKEKNDKAGQAFFQIMQMILYYIFEDHANGLTMATECEKNIDSLLGLPSIQIYYFFYALLLSSVASQNDKPEKKYLSKLKKIEKKFKKWSDACPDNYLNKYLLIKAEIARLERKPMEEIVKLYLESVKVGDENKLVHEAAIANERIAKYYLSRELDELAKTFMTNAYYGYMKWGCKPKMEDLKREYAELISMETLGYEQKITSTHGGSGHSSNLSSSSLDLAAILKTSQAISQEIKLDELLKKMMRITVENAGAEKGYFLLQKNGIWHIEAESMVDNIDVKVMQSVPIEQENGAPLVSIAVINYVERTRQSIVLNNAANDLKFKNDPYIKNNKPKSILCLPLVKQGEVIGIIYFENNLLAGSFTRERIDLLQTLAGYIAISLNNAVLYENLDNKVKERTVELEIERNKLKIRNTAMERDITLARKIQFNLIPQKIAFKFISHLYKPMEALGGDFYDIIQFKNSDKIGIFMSDVSGHGLAAAFNTSIIKTIILESGENAMNPAGLLSHMNELFYNLAGGNFVTVFYGVYDTKKRTLLYSNAGHNFPYVIFNKNVSYITGGKSTAIGVLPNNRLKSLDKSFHNCEEALPVGAKLFIYTDGLTEATPVDSDVFFEGSELESHIIKNSVFSAEKFTATLFYDLVRFRGNDSFDDDVCFLCMDIK
jgi:predicted ATPase/serine phosphatase RsbU (regulator of sigma subunit)